MAIDEGNDRYRAGYPRPTEGDMDELRHQLRIAQNDLTGSPTLP